MHTSFFISLDNKNLAYLILAQTVIQQELKL